MIPLEPIKLIVLGFVLLVIGLLLIFFMVLRTLSPSFALSFLAYGMSLVGLILGLMGVALHTQSRGPDGD